MDRVEPESLADVHDQLRAAVVAVGDPVADVLDGGERKPDDAADDRQRPAADPRLAAAGRAPHRSRARIAGEVAQARPAPITPVAPQAAICHGVHGPWPKKKFEVSPASAPTANPGPPPSA